MTVSTAYHTVSHVVGCWFQVRMQQLILVLRVALISELSVSVHHPSSSTDFLPATSSLLAPPVPTRTVYQYSKRRSTRIACSFLHARQQPPFLSSTHHS